MFTIATFRKYMPPYAFLIIVALLITILIDIYVVDYGISYREVIVGSGVLAGVLVLLAGRQGLKVGLVFFVATFGLGYRTMTLNPSLKFHPSELVIVGLLALLLLQEAIWHRSKALFALPFWLLLFIPFWLWGWWPLFSGNIQWELMFSECKNFVLFIPLYMLASTVLAEKGSWRSILLTFYLVGAWVASLGLVEYLFPQIKTFFPDFVSYPIPYETGEGFQRATFSFWGSTDAVYICVLALPMGTAVWKWWSASWARVLNVLLMAMMLGGVYISGHRNSWFIITLQFLILLAVKKRYLRAIAFLLVLILGFQFLPSAAQERIYSAGELVTGHPLKYDTSGVKRWSRSATSLSNSLEQPLGRGWAAAGWVHNDFLQVAENLGLAAGVLFFGAFIFTLKRLWSNVRTVSDLSEEQVPAQALLLSFMSAGIILATEAASVLPQLILPVWLIWASADIWMRQLHMKKVPIHDSFSTLGTLADLQLCDDRAHYFRNR